MKDIIKGVGKELKDIGKGVVKESTSGWGDVFMDQVFGVKKPKKDKTVIHIHKWEK